MYSIYRAAMRIAREKKSVILRLDIQFKFDIQIHIGYLMLANGDEYNITIEGLVSKITA